MKRIRVVFTSWVAAAGFALGGGTFLYVYEQSHPPTRESMVSQLPLSLEAATAIAMPKIAQMTNNRKDIVHSPPNLTKIGMGMRPEDGDFYYYNFEFSSVTEPLEQPTWGTVAVLLDGTAIESRPTGCPTPRFGRDYGFTDDVNVGAVYFSAIALLVLTTFLYAPVAVLLSRRARARLLIATCALAAIGAALALVRARLGLDYSLLDAPSGSEFGILLGVLPALLFVELLMRWLVSADGAPRPAG